MHMYTHAQTCCGHNNKIKYIVSRRSLFLRLFVPSFLFTQGALSATYIYPIIYGVCAPLCMGICTNVHSICIYIIFSCVAQSVSSSRKLQRCHFLSVFPATFSIWLCFVDNINQRKNWIFWNFWISSLRTWEYKGVIEWNSKAEPGFRLRSIQLKKFSVGKISYDRVRCNKQVFFCSMSNEQSHSSNSFVIINYLWVE